jgi:hypothetical protein
MTHKDEVKPGKDDIHFRIDLVEVAGRLKGPLSRRSQASLQKLLERYKNFWRLAKQHPDQPLVPSPEIDDMWHLHMLHPVAYYRDCMDYFGAILDHNPGFGQATEQKREIKELFEKTALLYEDSFSEKYHRLRDCHGGLLVGIKP